MHLRLIGVLDGVIGVLNGVEPIQPVLLNMLLSQAIWLWRIESQRPKAAECRGLTACQSRGENRKTMGNSETEKEER